MVISIDGDYDRRYFLPIVTSFLIFSMCDTFYQWCIIIFVNGIFYYGYLQFIVVSILPVEISTRHNFYKWYFESVVVSTNTIFY